MPATTDRITKTPGVCGGDACIRGHRIPVCVLVGYRRLGTSDADLLRFYPALTAANLEAAWQYAAANPEEIDRAIHRVDPGRGPERDFGSEGGSRRRQGRPFALRAPDVRLRYPVLGKSIFPGL